MSFFYNHLFKSNKSNTINNRFKRIGNNFYSAWINRHEKILIHSGLGGKNHILGKGHINWNRKGRW